MAQAEPATPVDLAAGTTVVSAFPCLIWAATCNAAAATTTVVLYDNATAGSGTVIGRLSTVANTSAGLPLLAPITCAKGCTAVVTGASGTAQVYFTRAT